MFTEVMNMHLATDALFTRYQTNFENCILYPGPFTQQHSELFIYGKIMKSVKKDEAIIQCHFQSPNTCDQLYLIFFP